MDQVNWDEKRYRYIETQITSFSGKLFKEVYFIPVCAQDGSNILVEKNTSCYSKSSFLDYLVAIPIHREDNTPVLTVYEKMRSSGNIFFYVKIDSGIFRKNIGYKIVPLEKDERIVQMSGEDDVEVEEMVAGESYKIKVKENSEELQEGMKMVSTDNNEYLSCTDLYAQLVVLDGSRAITVGYSAIAHINTQSVGCKVKDLITMDKKRTKIARKGDKVIAKIGFDSPVATRSTHGKEDRFTIRDQELTVASALVKKIIK
jgi:translation elongation factor EF-1alpha